MKKGYWISLYLKINNQENLKKYAEALKCHNSKEYQAGWDLAKDTTVRHMQVIEGFNTE